MMCYARYADRAVCATPTPIRCESRGLCAPEMTRFSDQTQRRGAQHRYIYVMHAMLCYAMFAYYGGDGRFAGERRHAVALES